MKNDGLSITAFCITILTFISTLSMITFSEDIRKVEWVSLEAIAFSCFGLAILSCLLGWCSYKRPLGKVSAILGTIAVAGFFFQLMTKG